MCSQRTYIVFSENQDFVPWEQVPGIIELVPSCAGSDWRKITYKGSVGVLVDTRFKVKPSKLEYVTLQTVVRVYIHTIQ